MLENLINQLLAEEKEEGLGKKFLEAFETSSVRGPGLHMGSHSGQFARLPWEAGVKKHRAFLLGPSLWPATIP